MCFRAFLLASLFVLPPTLLPPTLLHAQQPTLADVMLKLDGIDGKITGLSERVTQQEAKITNLDARLNDMASRVNEFEERQRQILVASSSGHVLDLRGQMEKPPFRDAFDSAVHDVLRDKEGTFKVTNKMSSYQRIMVNRVEYGLSAGESVTVAVPPGNVTTELPDQEPRNWSVTAPSYAEAINIVPAKTHTSYYRAADGGTSSLPVYTSYYSTSANTSTLYSPTYVAPVTTWYSSYVPSSSVVSPPVVVNYAPSAVLPSWGSYWIP